MSDYNDYITAVNKIFDYLAKMKAGWNNQDNMNYIERKTRIVVAVFCSGIQQNTDLSNADQEQNKFTILVTH